MLGNSFNAVACQSSFAAAFTIVDFSMFAGYLPEPMLESVEFDSLAADPEQVIDAPGSESD